MVAWNPVLNKVIEIKKYYEKMFGEVSYEKERGKTCLELWVDKIGELQYIDLIAPLQINQLGTKILIRYANFLSAACGMKEMSVDGFWRVHDGFYMECRSIVIDLLKQRMISEELMSLRLTSSHMTS